LKKSDNLLKKKDIELEALRNKAMEILNKDKPEDLKKKIEELSNRYLRYLFYFY